MARKTRLGDLLISLGLINPKQLEEALHKQQQHPAPLGAILIEMGAVTELALLRAVSAQTGFRAWRLEEVPPEKDALKLLNRAYCLEKGVLPVAVKQDLLFLAMMNPGDSEILEQVRGLTGLRIEPVVVDSTRMITALGVKDKEESQAKAAALDGLVELALEDARNNAVYNSNQALDEEDTRPVVAIVNQVLQDAIRMKASDIHIEPKGSGIVVRLRIDGRLRQIGKLPLRLMPMIAARIKIMSEMDVVETRLPQDGRIGAELDGRQVDLRISILPSKHGGRIVMRILDKQIGLKPLSELGFHSDDLASFRSLIKKPYGMVLVTGPTGSGKTTTLYAVLNEVMNEETNVITCEDPIEYELEGVSQSQVNEKAGLTFARQLRAILRQDPDVILVGEIRDHETAEIAIRAALTGHLVLSTLHCNDAPSAFPRLLDMGIDPFVLGSTVIGTVAQRLLRTLCPDCRSFRPTFDQEKALFIHYGYEAPDILPMATGCEACSQSGYRGRQAIHEVLPTTSAVTKLVSKRASADEIREDAVTRGFHAMQHRAIALILSGRTTLEEAQRVVFFDDLSTASGTASLDSQWAA